MKHELMNKTSLAADHKGHNDYVIIVPEHSLNSFKQLDVLPVYNDGQISAANLETT